MRGRRADVHCRRGPHERVDAEHADGADSARRSSCRWRRVRRTSVAIGIALAVSAARGVSSPRPCLAGGRACARRRAAVAAPSRAGDGGGSAGQASRRERPGSCGRSSSGRDVVGCSASEPCLRRRLDRLRRRTQIAVIHRRSHRPGTPRSPRCCSAASLRPPLRGSWRSARAHGASRRCPQALDRAPGHRSRRHSCRWRSAQARDGGRGRMASGYARGCGRTCARASDPCRSVPPPALWNVPVAGGHYWGVLAQPGARRRSQPPRSLSTPCDGRERAAAAARSIVRRAEQLRSDRLRIRRRASACSW